MGNKTQEKLIREMHSLQCYLQDHAIFISNIIKKHGEASVIRKARRNQEVDLDDYVHDYVFFCYTKGARSLLAADTLLTEGFFEDAKVVLRSAYECYLNASFVIRNPDNIVQLIILKVGEYSGRYTHPIDKKGRK